MANRRKRAGLRLTPLGYLVTGILALVVLVGVYFAVWSWKENRGAGGAQQGTDPVLSAPATNSPGTASMTATPSLAPIATPTIAPLSSDAPATLSSSPSTAPATSTSPDSTPTPPAVKTPTSSQKKNALDGELTTDGVVLRKGANRSFDVIKTYNSGTKLKVYEAEGEYYFVQIVDESIYGYMATKFIEKKGLLPGETASPTPKAPDGAVNGTVSVSVVALRKMPTTEGNDPIGELENGDAVYIYFKVDDFYYLEVVSSGLKCYAKASFFNASGSVPTGTPVP